MFNKDRKVPGPVNEECGLPGEGNSAPFGNWGVETETSGRKNGLQFAGWCRDKTVCDNNGDYWVACRDRWYEWNSCTSDRPRFPPQNTTLYNDSNGYRQESAGTGAVNSHGTGTIDVGVNCPVDNDGDHYPDSDDCKKVLGYLLYLTGHKMELWELDHWRPLDDKIGTICFPALIAPANTSACDAYGCDRTSIGSYRSKSSGTSAVSAKAAVRVLSATFLDEGQCCDPIDDPTCDD